MPIGICLQSTGIWSNGNWSEFNRNIHLGTVSEKACFYLVLKVDVGLCGSGDVTSA